MRPPQRGTRARPRRTRAEAGRPTQAVERGADSRRPTRAKSSPDEPRSPSPGSRPQLEADGRGGACGSPSSLPRRAVRVVRLRRCSGAPSRSAEPRRLPRHDMSTPACTRSEDPVVADEVEARRRHQGRELLEELLRLEDDVRRAVAPAVLQTIEERSVREPREPLGRHRRSRHVAAQALEAAPVARRDGDVRVQAHAADARAALALERPDLRVDAVADAQHALAGAAPRGDAAADRGAVELGEERLLGQPVGLRADSGPSPRRSRRRCDAPRDLAATRATSASSGGGRGWKRGGSNGVRLVDAVEHERVEVDVEVQCVAEALHEGDGAALGARDAPLLRARRRSEAKTVAHEDRRARRP
jgi:hypothetical protein